MPRPKLIWIVAGVLLCGGTAVTLQNAARAHDAPVETDFADEDAPLGTVDDHLARTAELTTERLNAVEAELTAKARDTQAELGPEDAGPPKKR